MPPASSALKFKAVLFDLDGTLLHTAPELAYAANAMLESMGRMPLPEPVIASFIGGGLRRTVASCLAGRLVHAASGVGQEPALVEQAMERFEAAYRKAPGTLTQPYAGVIDGLSRLRAAGMAMGVVTNKAGRFTDELLELKGLSGYFGVVVSGDTLPVQKPHPQPLLHACAALKVDPALALFIGDSAHDVATARAAGTAVWCVPYGYNEGRPVETLACDRVVADLNQAAMLIGA